MTGRAEAGAAAGAAADMRGGPSEPAFERLTAHPGTAGTPFGALPATIAGAPVAGGADGHADADDAVMRWASARVARQVTTTVWQTLPYGRGELRALVESIELLRARIASIRAQAAGPRTAAAPAATAAGPQTGEVAS